MAQSSPSFSGGTVISQFLYSGTVISQFLWWHSHLPVSLVAQSSPSFSGGSHLPVSLVAQSSPSYINHQYIVNSSWHWGSYGSIWTGPSPNKYYMDRSSRGKWMGEAPCPQSLESLCPSEHMSGILHNFYKPL